MSAIALAPSVLVAFWSGCMLVQILWRDTDGTRIEYMLRGALGLGIGLGMHSALAFLWMAAMGSLSGGIIGADLALAGALTLAYFLVRTPGESDFQPRAPLTRLQRILCVGFALGCASSLFHFVGTTLSQPHGAWDAWMTWNLKARFLFRAGADWRDVFFNHPNCFCADYPLLVPGLVARGWRYLGHESMMAPALNALLFTCAAVAGVTFATARSRSLGAGLLAGTILLATPYFLKDAARQYADVPLAFFMLSAIVMFGVLDEATRRRRGPAILAGLCLGLAAWTKNEGLLFTAVVLAVRPLAVVWFQGLRAALAETSLVVLGAAPLLGLAVYLRTLVPPGLGRQLVGADETLPQALERLIDPARYAEIFGWMRMELFRPDKSALMIVPLLLLWAWLSGARRDTEWRLTFASGLAVLGLVALGYFTVWVLSLYDLELNVVSTIHRLQIQLWPSFLFLFFLAVRTPEQAIEPDRA